MREVIAIGRWFEGSDLSPFLGDRENVASFQEEGKYQDCRKVEKTLLRTGTRSGAQDFRTIAGIPSGQLDLEVLR